MEVVGCMHSGQSQGVGRMLEDPGAFPEHEVKTVMTANLTAFQVRSSA